MEPVYCCPVEIGSGKRAAQVLFAVYAAEGRFYYGPGLRKHPTSTRGAHEIRKGAAVQLCLGGDPAFSGYALIPCVPSTGDLDGAVTISAPLDLGLFLHSLGVPICLLDGDTEQEVPLHLGEYSVVHALPAADAFRPVAPPNVIKFVRHSA